MVNALGGYELEELSVSPSQTWYLLPFNYIAFIQPIISLLGRVTHLLYFSLLLRLPKLLPPEQILRRALQAMRFLAPAADIHDKLMDRLRMHAFW